MKYISRLIFPLALILISAEAGAWNLPAKHVNALRFLKNGEILFTLFDSGTSGQEFRCVPPNNQWFRVTACGVNDAVCISAVNRMASALLAAKVSRKSVHVQRSACDVTEVALKP